MSRIVCLWLMLLSLPALAQSQVRVLALFPGKAMLDIDGQRKVLSKGQRAGAVELLEASPREARIRVDGRVETLRLGNAVGTHFAPRAKEELRLLRNGEGFFADALINGQPVRMLVDTGASTVAMSEVRARQLGIPYVLDGEGATVSTASGTSPAYRVTLDSLKLGTQTFNGIQALVVQGDSPPVVLLGMNVLRRFDVDHRGDLMILRAKY